MTDDADRVAALERRVERLEKVVTQLVTEARARQAKNTEHTQDRRTVTEKVTFDWQGANPSE